MAQCYIGTVGKAVCDAPADRRGPVLFVSSDTLKCTWLASDLQQTPNLIKL